MRADQGLERKTDLFKLVLTTDCTVGRQILLLDKFREQLRVEAIGNAKNIEKPLSRNAVLVGELRQPQRNLWILQIRLVLIG